MEDIFGGISGGLTFDSSLSESLDKSLSIDEYKARIHSHLEPLLRERFAGQSGKQKIFPHVDRVTFSCPYCGDSMQSSYKKRGNIIFQGKFAGHFKCFNCGTFKGVDDFFKDYNITLQLDFVNYLIENKGNFKRASYGNYNLSILMDTEKIEGYAIDREELKKRFSLVEIDKSPLVPWLRKRLQFDDNRFLYNSQYDYLVILNLTTNGKILGFQRRNFDKKLEKYNTFNLRRIYKEFEWDKEIPEEIDVLSQLYKIFEMDFNRPVYLFEGPLDAFLLPNSVANAGLSKGFPIEMPLRYWLDDDKDGRQKAILLLSEGEYVFLWDKFKREYGLPFRKKWDLNDVFIYLKENNIKPPFFDKYFSNDPLDTIDI
jgi:predicted RNA-binding Zn-ribbon protein involved in translation (DUF1610 family)